jgi:hypothetical protein
MKKRKREKNQRRRWNKILMNLDYEQIINDFVIKKYKDDI